MNVSVVVLAAGKGTRMKSDLPKVLHKVLGKSILAHSLDTLSFIESQYVVVGHESDMVIDSLPSSTKHILQKDQLGTGHAVSTVVSGEMFVENKSEFTLVVPGDVPAIVARDIQNLISEVKTKSSSVGFLTSIVENPHGYGRVVRNNEEIRIVEEKDCNDDERKINEINSGIYCFNTDFLIENIDSLDTKNAQGEFYLTDLIGIANNQKQDIVIVQVDEDSIKGINSMSQLNEVETSLREELITSHMENGVYFQDPTSTYIDKGVVIKAGSRIMANTHLTGTTEIHDNCVVGPNTMINDSTIGEGSSVIFSVLDGVTIKGTGIIGPYAHLRKGSILEEGVKVGAFAETKNSNVGSGSKIPHLSYVGDADLEENVNFSAGSITVNYDGKNKHRTEIKKDAFVGSDVMLVAPVTVGEGAMIGAGSVITKDVPPKALGIERNQQKNIDGYMDRKKSKDEK